MITIEIDDRRVLDVLAELAARLDDLTPAMQSIGEYLVGSTKRRFATSIGPDGMHWAPNSQVTYLRMLERAHGVTLKGGRINQKGANMAMAKKPLVGESHRLSSEISAQAGRYAVEVGSPMVYAAVQQFGTKKGAFGVGRGRRPIPWGDIPARPFIGLSEADADQVLKIVGEFLSSPAE